MMKKILFWFAMLVPGVTMALVLEPAAAEGKKPRRSKVVKDQEVKSQAEPVEVLGENYYLKRPNDGWKESKDSEPAFSGTKFENDEYQATLQFSWEVVVDEETEKKRSARAALASLLKYDLENGGKKRSGIVSEAGGSRLSYVVDFKDEEGVVTRNKVTVFTKAVGEDYPVASATWPVENDRLASADLKKILGSLVFLEPKEDETEPDSD